MPELESFNRENVCFCGPDALDGSAVIYICLSRLKTDHLKLMNSILVRIYVLCAAASKRPFNILVDCSAVQASNAAVIDVIKDLATTLIAAFEPSAKKRLKSVFLVHASVGALRDIQAFLAAVAPRLLQKVGACTTRVVPGVVVVYAGGDYYGNADNGDDVSVATAVFLLLLLLLLLRIDE